MHKIYDVRHHHSEENLNVRLTKELSGLLVESVGLMYSADCGLVDSRTCGPTDSRLHRLADSHRKYLQLKYFVLCRHTARVSPRVRETHAFADSEYIRPNRWASLYLELHRMSLYSDSGWSKLPSKSAGISRYQNLNTYTPEESSQ